MSQPNFQLFELDGALGAQPDGDPILAFVGCATSGPIATPAAFGRTKDVVSNFTSGPVVEAACFYIATYKKPAIVVRATSSVAASNGTIDTTGVTGTSVATITAGTLADNDYDLQLKIVTGGTRGTTGITFTYSYDGGRTPSAVTALGTAVVFAFPNAGTISFDLGVGTLIAGDVIKLRTNGPNFNATDLGLALDALRKSTYNWELVSIRGALDATLYAAVGTSFAAMTEKAWVGHCRMPLITETEITYLTAMTAIFGSLSNTYGSLCYGAAKITSGVNFRQYRQPISVAYAALLGSVSPEIDVSAIDVGSIPGVVIRDANGNPDEHDETANPGADDARFVTLRTWDDETAQGVFINNPRLHSPTGSDFEFMPHRRVMNRAKRVLRRYFNRRLSQPILVNAKTGYILESQAVEIEQGANEALAAALLARPMVSGGAFDLREFVKVSRTDNLLSTKTLTAQAGIVPLVYPKTIIVDIGFRNPALQVLKAAA